MADKSEKSQLMDILIKTMTPKDWEFVRAIYEEGIATGDATFETKAPATWEDWDSNHLQTCRLVVKNESRVIGWAALSPVSKRHVYRGIAEVSIYIAGSARGLGIGKTLLRALIVESESAGIWTLQAGIFPENIASIALHKDCGFREIGYRERIGEMNGIWRDVTLLEHRSKVVGG